MRAGIICISSILETSPARADGGGSRFLKASTSLSPLLPGAASGRPITKSQSSGKSCLKIIGGRSPVVPTLCPPSTMKPPCLNAYVPMPERLERLSMRASLSGV